MSNSLSKIYDDYEDYCLLCEKVGVKPKDIENYDDHEKEIMKKYGWERTYYGYKKKVK